MMIFGETGDLRWDHMTSAEIMNFVANFEVVYVACYLVREDDYPMLFDRVLLFIEI